MKAEVAQVAAPSQADINAYLEAAYKGDVAKVTELLGKEGKLVDAKDITGKLASRLTQDITSGGNWNAAHFAVRGGHSAVLAVIMAKAAADKKDMMTPVSETEGVRSSSMVFHGYSPAHMAVRLGMAPEDVAVLLNGQRESRPVVGEEKDAGMCIPHVAARYSPTPQAYLGLEAAYTGALLTADGWNAAHIAAFHGKAEAIPALGRVVDLNVPILGKGNYQSFCPVHLAVSMDRSETVAALRVADANMGAVIPEGEFAGFNAMHLAAFRRSSPATIQALGGDVNASVTGGGPYQGWSAFQIFASKVIEGRGEGIATFDVLAARTDVNAPFPSGHHAGKRPVDVAIAQNIVPLIEQFVAIGVITEPQKTEELTKHIQTALDITSSPEQYMKAMSGIALWARLGGRISEATKETIDKALEENLHAAQEAAAQPVPEEKRSRLSSLFSWIGISWGTTVEEPKLVVDSHMERVRLCVKLGAAIPAGSEPSLRTTLKTHDLAAVHGRLFGAEMEQAVEAGIMVHSPIVHGPYQGWSAFHLATKHCVGSRHSSRVFENLISKETTDVDAPFPSGEWAGRRPVDVVIEHGSTEMVGKIASRAFIPEAQKTAELERHLRIMHNSAEYQRVSADVRLWQSLGAVPAASFQAEVAVAAAGSGTLRTTPHERVTAANDTGERVAVVERTSVSKK